jgi:hypothetical protein
MQEEFVSFATLRGRFAAGVVARRRTELVEVVESLPLAAKRLGDFVRGRMGESERQVDGLFQSLLSQSFGE